MAELENKQLADKENPKTKKELFMERFSQNYPDIASDDEEGFYGKIGEEFDRFDRSEKAQKEFGELLGRDPRSAGFLMVLKNGGNPMEYLIEQYGDEFREALNDEEKAKELADAFSKYAEKQAKSAELDSKAEANMQVMLGELDSAKGEGSFTDEDAMKAFEYLYAEGGLLDRILTNEVHKEDWMMLMKAAKYDEMVSQAHHEGVIEGRNANIDIEKRKRDKAKKMPSTPPAGGDVKTSKNQNSMIKMLDERRKSVWED